MNKKTFTPPRRILENYANVLVNFALGECQGIKKGDTVIVQLNEYAKPLYAEIVRAIWKSGGHVISIYSPDDDDLFKYDRTFFELAKDHQLDYFPEKFMKGLVDQADHILFVISETDKKSLNGIDSSKIMRQEIAYKPYRNWRQEKESAGKFTWTIGLYGTPAMSKEAGLSEKEYWAQIIDACFLDRKDPIKEWKKVYREMESYRTKLNALPIDKLHIVGTDADLWITLGKNRRWASGRGANIPSFELFTSPDWRGTNGWIRFNQPLYRYGNLIEGIELEFKDGLVVRCKAKKNEKVLKAMVATKNADKIGEYSLTDKRFSRITKFMAETLYDENVGGPFGNTHLALGSSYHETYSGNQKKFTKKDWANLGFNDSSVHTDIISTTDRVVTAHLANGKEKVIYKDGQFQL